jgi:hypothetical protein
MLKLHALLRFHRAPINQIVFLGAVGATHKTYFGRKQHILGCKSLKACRRTMKYAFALFNFFAPKSTTFATEAGFMGSPWEI